LGIIETSESAGLIPSGAVPADRKPLSPAFRMAVLTGALESVRLHLRSGNEVDATDEKGRSPLMLAASRGHLDVCRLLLESGADPGLKDSEGNDAFVIAIMRGQAAAAVLLSVVPTRSNPGSDRNGNHGAVSHTNELEADSAGIIDEKEGVAAQAGESARQHAETSDEVTKDVLPCSPMPDDDGPFDISVWQEEIKSTAPADDPACADAASGAKQWEGR
jgi:RNA polymerase primary sigma factor